MKIRSKALWAYLNELGVLTQGEEAIAIAKREYRKQYKREHKRKRIKKEVRPLFSPKEYEALSVRANLFNLCPTSYAREVIMQAQQVTKLIPNRDELLSVLQKVSIAVIASNTLERLHELPQLLIEAEAQLLKYLGYDFQNTSEA